MDFYFSGAKSISINNVYNEGGSPINLTSDYGTLLSIRGIGLQDMKNTPLVFNSGLNNVQLSYLRK